MPPEFPTWFGAAYQWDPRCALHMSTDVASSRQGTSRPAQKKTAVRDGLTARHAAACAGMEIKVQLKQYGARIRNIALTGHGGGGKTC